MNAGTFTHGVFKTFDGGAHWAPSNTGRSELAVQSLVLDPTHTGTLYAIVSNDVFKTTDGGAHWTAIGAGLTDSYGPPLPPRRP